MNSIIMDFTLVFPSNAQPQTYRNTASYFQTDLDNPIDLNGQWEVALQDLSYVNSIKTLSNESVLLGYISDDNIASGALESTEKVKTFDLQTLSSQWSSKIDSSPTRYRRGTKLSSSVGKFMTQHFKMVRKRDKERCEALLKEEAAKVTPDKVSLTSDKRAYDNKVLSLLNVLNQLAPTLWTWRYDVYHNIILLNLRPTSNQVYGFYVSKDLQKILGLTHQLFLPSSKFPYGDQSNTFLLQTNRVLTLSHKLQHVSDWNKLDLKIALLPFHRMDVKEIAFKGMKTHEQLIQAMSKACAPYGVTMSRPDSKLLIKNSNDIESSNVALIELNEELMRTFALKRNVFWRKGASDYIIDATHTIEDGCGIRIYMKNIKRIPLETLQWDVEQEVKLPAKYYNNPHDLCVHLNRGDKTKFSYEFGYNDISNKFHVYVRESTVVRISATLASVLGFNQSQFYLQNTIASHPSTLITNVNHFYVYTNFIQPSQVGGKPVPLLRYIPLDVGEYGQTMYKEFLNKVYIPTNVSRLQHCEFGIFDDHGKPIEFVGGRTVLTLHFRKVTS